MAITDFIADAAAFSNPFGTPSRGQWNIQKGVFINALGQELVFFYEERKKDESGSILTALEQVGDSGGRRLAVYKYPYKDGQRLDDLGREGFTFTFNIKFFGANYQLKLKEFISRVVNVRGQGTLNHPVLSPLFGAFSVRFQNFEFVHRHDEWNAITIRAIFVEDSNEQLNAVTSAQSPSTDSVLRQGLQNLVSAQAAISQSISDVSALITLPGAISAALNARLTSITGQISRLFGQLGATFSSDVQLKQLAAQSANIAGGVGGLTSGTAQSSSSGGKTSLQALPPVFQVGYDPSTQAAVEAQISAFTDANTVTPQQAIFSANQARAALTEAIAEANTNLGNYAYDIVLQYRGLAVTIQQSVEASVSSSQSRVKLFTLQVPMSLRQVAKANGLSPDRANDIEALNPYLGSVNYVPRGTVLAVPAA